MTTPSPTPPHIALLATKAAEKLISYLYDEHALHLKLHGDEPTKAFTAIIESAITRALLEAATAAEWQPIATLNRKEMQFVLVTDGDTTRLHLWNPNRAWWEPSPPRMGALTIEDDCHDPTHWMRLPAAPDAGKEN